MTRYELYFSSKSSNKVTKTIFFEIKKDDKNTLADTFRNSYLSLFFPSATVFSRLIVLIIIVAFRLIQLLIILYHKILHITSAKKIKKNRAGQTLLLACSIELPFKQSVAITVSELFVFLLQISD